MLKNCFLISFLAAAAAWSLTARITFAEERLIFHSGFEPGVKVVPQTGNHEVDIVGADASLPSPNDWEHDLEVDPNVRDFIMQYCWIPVNADIESGNDADRLTSIYNDGGNHVLRYRISKPHVVGRYQNKGKIHAGFRVKDLDAFHYRVKTADSS